MSDGPSIVENDVQDKNSEAWQRLCEYVDAVARENREEFSPFEALGRDLYFQIHTLPESIADMKSVKKMWLYGSKLKRIPPEIGKMESLEYFDPYTSYNLHWFPYEITRCKQLKDSRVSTRALYGNYKNRMEFPDLRNNPVRYAGEFVYCSICGKQMTYAETNQVWTSLRVGTDTLPLLVNLCSKECGSALPSPPKGFNQQPHKGGRDLVQPSYEEWEKEHVTVITAEELDKLAQKKQNEPLKPLKLIRKLWEKDEDDQKESKE